MTEKRYRTERIEGATLPFIVDNYTAKKHNKTMTGYKAYDTTTVEKCDELTGLLNNYEKECEQLKERIAEQGIQLDFLKDENQHMRTVLEENHELKKTIKKNK